MYEVIYQNDRRYPGPPIIPSPPEITGIPTQEELDAYPKLYSWGDIKSAIQGGQLELRVLRNRQLCAKYHKWRAEVKDKWGGTEQYLKEHRLPWPKNEYDNNNAVTHQLEDTDANLKSHDKVSATYMPLREVDPEVDIVLQDSKPRHLIWEGKESNREAYAVLYNDWPASVPYGVRHLVVWLKMPIAHPDLVNGDPTEWDKILKQGLSGFTGVNTCPIMECTAALNKGEMSPDDSPDWLSHDVNVAGEDIKKWHGVQHESKGGHEVGKMVRDLWDERGWECVWYVNPPGMQTVPGLAHYHVLARRKTPTEITAAEAAYGTAK